MTKTINSFVTIVLQSFVKENIMFTAFDVTNSVRALDPNTYVSHEQVKDQVHEDMVLISGYTRTYCMLQPTGAEAYVYHPVNTNPYSYDSNTIKKAINASVDAINAFNQPNSKNPLVSTSKEDVSKYVYLSADQRLRLGKELTAKIGVTLGDFIYSEEVNGKILISNTTPSNVNHKKYRVDMYGNVVMRVSKSKLRSATYTNKNLEIELV